MDSKDVPEAPKTSVPEPKTGVQVTLKKSLQGAIYPDLEEMAQEELGHLTKLLPEICENPHLCQQMEIALTALEKNNLNLKLALIIREDLEIRLEEAKVKGRLKKLNEDFKNALLAQRAADYQDELAQFIQLLPEIGCDESLTGALEVAAQALLQEQPNLPLASKIRKHIQSRLKKKKSLLQGASPSSQVFLGGLTFLGAVFLIFVATPLLLKILAYVFNWGSPLAGAFQPNGVFGWWGSGWGIIPPTYKYAAAAGAVGGFTSLMVRMTDFARLHDANFAILFSIGLFRPLIGLIFAIFVVGIVESGILAVTVDEGKKKPFCLILGFIAGYSDIFARDILTKAERTVGGFSRKKLT
jgi:hypothetical protein